MHKLDSAETFAGGSGSCADPSVSVRRARAAGVALNWWLNQNLRRMFDFECTRLTGQAPLLAADRPEKKALRRFVLAF